MYLTQLLGDSEGNSILWPELLQFRYNAICYVGRHFRHQTVLHSFFDVQSVFQRKVDEVSIDKHVIRRAELLVVLKEQSRTGFR